jgi:hypothetical protein
MARSERRRHRRQTSPSPPPPPARSRRETAAADASADADVARSMTALCQAMLCAQARGSMGEHARLKHELRRVRNRQTARNARRRAMAHVAALESSVRALNRHIALERARPCTVCAAQGRGGSDESAEYARLVADNVRLEAEVAAWRTGRAPRCTPAPAPPPPPVTMPPPPPPVTMPPPPPPVTMPRGAPVWCTSRGASPVPCDSLPSAAPSYASLTVH